MSAPEPALILASASPRRRELLARLGIEPVSIVAPNVDETPKRAELPRVYARRIARAKADNVAPDGALVLAADTVVAVGRRIIPKAATADQARSCLEMLSGRRHRVITAVLLRGPGGCLSERVVVSVVGFARLTPARITAYLETGEWQGKAGGYAIQGRAEAFVRFLSGSYSNVVGLPLFETAQLLRAAGCAVP
ncbi:MAG TPA: Maf family protein [Acetobacteraceae bacterium]|nr:Maf family protein [Acetobacteraceae bacterium]